MPREKDDFVTETLKEASDAVTDFLTEITGGPFGKSDDDDDEDNCRCHCECDDD